jgi:hypothetical protein
METGTATLEAAQRRPSEPGEFLTKAVACFVRATSFARLDPYLERVYSDIAEHWLFLAEHTEQKDN